MDITGMLLRNGLENIFLGQTDFELLF
jgi:hypothetical protein